MRRHPLAIVGFTLSEVLIVVVVLGLLVAMAIPQYGKYMERSYWRGARDILQTIYAGEQVYSSQFLTPKFTTIWNEMYMDDPNAGPLNPAIGFAVIAGGGIPFPTFTATATRSGTLCPPNAAWTLTKDQTPTWGGTATAEQQVCP